MPLYDFHHAIPLTPIQKQLIAERTTYLHSRKFTTPSLFVNVFFTPCGPEASTSSGSSNNSNTEGIGYDSFVAGKPKLYNKCFINVRPGGTRKTEDFEYICDEVVKIWDGVVYEEGLPVEKRDEKRSMRAVFVQASLVAGLEAGFKVPMVRDDFFFPLLVLLLLQSHFWGEFSRETSSRLDVFAHVAGKEHSRAD